MKLVGEKYLLDTLRQVINKVVEAGLDCEVSAFDLYTVYQILSSNNYFSLACLTCIRVEPWPR